MTDKTTKPLIERLREHANSFDRRTTHPTAALAGAELCREAADAIEAHFAQFKTVAAIRSQELAEQDQSGLLPSPEVRSRGAIKKPPTMRTEHLGES